MALKTTTEKTSAEKPAQEDSVTLELALYTHYTWGGVTYEKGSAYRFKREDAMALMGEQDHGRPVWKMWTPPRVKVAARMPIVDSTEVRAVRTRQSIEEAALRGVNTGKKIEVGSDDEIADILDRPGEGEPPVSDGSGDVVV